MKRPVLFSLPLAVFAVAAVFLLLSCSAKEQVATEEAPPATIESLVVLPVEIQKSENGYDTATTRHLETGAATLNAMLQEMLADKKGLQFLTENRKESMLADFHGNPQATARYLGQQLGVDAVLVTLLSRYSERDGGEYSVNDPASVSFKTQLIHVATGTTLCLGVFDETQQTLLSNLFSFAKASKRGFKWITVEQLSREGLHEKLNDCRYTAE
ncbi:MAG: hypothetical protein HY789_07060 [Deltaproteobacteria bacterium]|nr:hypothetical protein [Deltaproteobacteria bacterium]